MQTATGQPRYGAALAAVGVAAATTVVPATTLPAVLTGVHRAVQLTADGDSVLNIPFNLFQQVVNIPGTEVQALNVLANSLMFTGNWFTPSATNLWGEDPGDPGHFMATVDMLVPFQAISGLGSPEIDPAADAAGTAGLGQQLALLVAAELPVSASCDADWCAPLVPATEITGITAIDRTIWSLATLTGAQPFPLFNNWFQVPLSDLAGGHFTFGDVVNPSQGVGPDGSVPDGFGFPGTVAGSDGANLMPWSGLDFRFDPLGPVQNFAGSLLASPDPSGFDIPTVEEIGRAMQSFAAGMVVDFNPYVAGSPACVMECVLPGNGALSTEGIVASIGNAWPGNPLINQWLAETADGTANGPTPHQTDFAIQFMQGQQQNFDVGNPAPSNPPAGIDSPAPFDVSPALAGLIQAMQDSGVQNLSRSVADLIGFDPGHNPGGFSEGLSALNQQFVDWFDGLSGPASPGTAAWPGDAMETVATEPLPSADVLMDLAGIDPLGAF